MNPRLLRPTFLPPLLLLGFLLFAPALKAANRFAAGREQPDPLLEHELFALKR